MLPVVPLCRKPTGNRSHCLGYLNGFILRDASLRDAP